jgi:hypothetical protein
MSPMPRASRAQGDNTVRTDAFDGFFLFFREVAFFAGRERDPLLPDLREGEVFVAMFRQA